MARSAGPFDGRQEQSPNQERERRDREARPIDRQAFVLDPDDPDNPTVTFGASDATVGLSRCVSVGANACRSIGHASVSPLSLLIKVLAAVADRAIRRRRRWPSPRSPALGWPDRRVQVTAARSNLLIKSESGETEARPIDRQAFVLDPDDPDNPTVTFGASDATGRPTVLYDMLWGLPRLNQ